ncbi:MAG: M1 family aminopeptidase [Candidatus Krumholzibacteria bacterium]|nr:M1 family aminopeptidase [Candidatus Krumholzibacteria bacterium]
MKRLAILLALIAALGGGVPVRAGEGGLEPDPLRYVAPSRPFKTLHTRLELDLDLEGRTIAGAVTHRMRALRTLDEIRLNCVGLTVESCAVDGAAVEFDYPVPGGRSTSWIGSAPVAEADDELVLRAPSPLARGSEFEVTVSYRGAPRQGLYFIPLEKGLPSQRLEVWSQGEGENNRHWIPCHDYPDDKATFEGIFRVKRGNYVLSNGVLVSRTDEGDWTRFHWRLDQPQVSYLIMVAAGAYDVLEEDAGGVPLLYVVPPGTDPETVRRAYGPTRDMMAFFNRTIGIDYPFGKYAQVVVQNFIYGGMENSSATVMNTRTLYDERAELTRNEHGLVAHELAHQWWGDMVTCREWSHMWLNEGFATYYQSLYREYSEGDDAFRYEMRARHDAVVANDEKEARPVAVDFFNRKDARNNANIYIKGASFLHTLRFLLGDELYHEVIRHYGRARMHDTAETADLARAVRDVTGENLDWLFEQWIYLAGHPEFAVSSSWDQGAGMMRLSVRQTQETGGLVPVFRVPLDVEVTCDERVDVHRIVCDREAQDFYFAAPSRPRMVIFDKGDWNLKSLDFPKPVADLLYQLEHGDYIARVRAAEALGGKGADARAVPALRTTLLAGGHWGLRREAALALARAGGPAARDALLAGMVVEDARVRLACAKALGDFNEDEAAAEGLREALRRDPAYGVQEAAVASLVSMRADGAAKACEDAMGLESHGNVVRNAGMAGLAELGETRALSLIQRYCRSGNARTQRHAAMAAYARLAKQLRSEGERERAADFLAAQLDDWHVKTRLAAVGALESLGEKAGVAPLRRAASSDPLEQVRGAARRAADRLESLGSEKTDVEAAKARIRRLEDRVDELGDEVEALRRAGGVERP